MSRSGTALDRAAVKTADRADRHSLRYRPSGNLTSGTVSSCPSCQLTGPEDAIGHGEMAAIVRMERCDIDVIDVAATSFCCRTRVYLVTYGQAPAHPREPPQAVTLFFNCPCVQMTV